MHSVVETWEIVVHALRRIEVSALVHEVVSRHGPPPAQQPLECDNRPTLRSTQATETKLLLRGDRRMSHGLVRLFSTDAAEVSLDPAVPFALPAGALKEVSVRLRPEQQGRKQYLVHTVAAPFEPGPGGDRPGVLLHPPPQPHRWSWSRTR